MLSIDRLWRKGVNPFCSHLQDKSSTTFDKRCHADVKKPVRKPAFSL